MNSLTEETLSKGLFVCLRVSSWTASRKVATSTVEIGEGADEKLFRVNKDLIDRSLLRPIRVPVQKANEYLYTKSLPFQLRGVRFVPCDMVDRVNEKVQEYERNFWEAVGDFVAMYGKYREKAKISLGGHFRFEDYPQEIRENFRWDFKMLGFTAPGRGLQAVSPALLREAEHNFQKDIEEFRSHAAALLREQFSELLHHCVDRLTPSLDGKPKIFRDSMVNNLRLFLEDFRSLNLSNDEELQFQVERVKNLTEGMKPDMLRNSGQMAQKAKQQFELVKRTVDQMICESPRRRIRFAEDVA